LVTVEIIRDGRLKHAGFFSFLKQLMEQDPELEIRTVAAHALGLQGDQRAVEPILQAWAVAKSAGLYTGGYIWGLYHLKDPRALPMLEAEVLKPYSYQTEFQAKEAIEAMIGKEAIEAISSRGRCSAVRSFFQALIRAKRRWLSQPTSAR
jgi:hypothetical protein